MLAGAAVLGGCGSSAKPSASSTVTLDTARVEHAIERSIMRQRHLESRVVCPKAVPQRPGKFPCVATTFRAKEPRKTVKTPFVVTVHGTHGYVTYVGK